MNTKLWTQKDGTKIRIKDMGDKHLVNTIRMLERVHERNYSEAVQAGHSALVFLSGEMAIMHVEQELDALENDYDSEGFEDPLYFDLTQEAERRKLDWK